MKRVTFSHSPIPYLFVLPQIAIIAVFFLWPSFEAIQLSFYLEDPWGLSNEFVWFENYQTIFEDPEYVGTLIATLIFSLSVTFLSLRLAMLLAVLHRHGGVATYDQDVFVNVVGGVKVLETAVDLALLAAVMSSLRNRPLPMDLMVFGELGLSGEIRPVPSGQERLKEAAKHGFTRAIVPKANAPKEPPKGMQVIAVTRLDQALAAIFE